MQRMYQKYLSVLILSSLIGLMNLSAQETPDRISTDLIAPSLEQAKREKYLINFSFIPRKVRDLENVKPGATDISFKLADGSEHTVDFTPDTQGNFAPAETVLDLAKSVKGYQTTINSEINVLYAIGKKQTKPNSPQSTNATKCLFKKANLGKFPYYTQESRLLW